MPYISGTIGVPIALRNLLVSATFLIGLSAGRDRERFLNNKRSV